MSEVPLSTQHDRPSRIVSLTYRIALYCFCLGVFWALLSNYRMIRSDRVNTRWAVLLGPDGGEFTFRLPEGSYQIIFANEPRVGPGMRPLGHEHFEPSVHTRILTSSRILVEETNSHFGFRISTSEQYTTCRLLVSVERRGTNKIFMSIGSSL